MQPVLVPHQTSISRKDCILALHVRTCVRHPINKKTITQTAEKKNSFRTVNVVLSVFPIVPCGSIISLRVFTGRQQLGKRMIKYSVHAQRRCTPVYYLPWCTRSLLNGQAVIRRRQFIDITGLRIRDVIFPKFSDRYRPRPSPIIFGCPVQTGLGLEMSKIWPIFKIWSLLVYRAVLKLKHGFYHYSDFLVDNRHTWRWNAWKTPYLWEGRVRNAESLSNTCPTIWRLTDRFPNRSEFFFWTPKISGPDWHHYFVSFKACFI